MNVGPILQRFRRCYNDLCRQLLIIDFGSLDNLPINENGFVEAPTSFPSGSIALMKKLYMEVHNFLVASSDDYAVMRPEYQTRLFSNFMRIWHSFDGCYRSAKHYGNTPGRIFASFGRYIDIDNMMAFYPDMPESLRSEDAMRITQEYLKKNVAIALPAITRLKLTDEEYVGIMAYLLWNITVKFIPEELMDLAERNKTAVLHELHTYYKSKGIKDYSARLGEIFVYLSLVEGLIDSSVHIIDVYKLLDVVEEQTYNLTKLSLE